MNRRITFISLFVIGCCIPITVIVIYLFMNFVYPLMCLCLGLLQASHQRRSDTLFPDCTVEYCLREEFQVTTNVLQQLVICCLLYFIIILILHDDQLTVEVIHLCVSCLYLGVIGTFLKLLL